MEITALDVISAAITSVGQLGKGRSPSAEDSDQGLRVLNWMIETWSIKKRLIFQVQTLTVPLTANLQDYTMGQGVGATFLRDRPVFIESAQVVIPGGVMQNPLSILSKSQWDAIADQGARTSVGGVPDKIWVEYLFPNLAFHLHPIQATATNLKLGIWAILQAFTNVFDVVQLPPGYQRAIVTNLAIELCPYYDMVPSQALFTMAADALTSLQAINTATLMGALEDTQTLVSAVMPAQTGQAQ